MSKKLVRARRECLVMLAATTMMGPFACTGSIPGHGGGGNANTSNGATGSGGTSAGAGPATAGMTSDGAKLGGPPIAESAGPRPLRRLTRAEYNNTVHDLLGDTTRPADAFPVETRDEDGFFDPLAVSDVETSHYRDASEALAAQATANQLGTLAPCAKGASAAAEDACAATFITGFGQRAFRRPLSSDEVTTLTSLYTTVRGDPLKATYQTGIEVLITAMLQTPQFLYHWETVKAATPINGLISLNPYEVASRLSYFLWASMPDATLFAAAAGGALSTPAALEQQARRMLADSRAAASVQGFFEQLLETEKLDTLVKDTKVYPQFNQALADAMAAETDAFTSYAVLQDGHLDTLFTSPVSFVNGPLATLYGVSGVTGSALSKVTLDSTKRFGLLTQGAFLTVQANTYETSPVLRGKAILTRFLCEAVPPPPPDVDTSVSATQAGQQTRDKFEAHESNPTCAACHKLMDPIGFALEAYDGIGAYRTTDAGRPVRTDGTVLLPSGSVAVSGAQDLVNLVAKSDASRQCAATQWLRYSLGRADVPADTGSLQAAMQSFSMSNYDIRELMVALAKSKTFLNRAPSEGEVL